MYLLLSSLPCFQQAFVTIWKRGKWKWAKWPLKVNLIIYFIQDSDVYNLLFCGITLQSTMVGCRLGVEVIGTQPQGKSNISTYYVVYKLYIIITISYLSLYRFIVFYLLNNNRFCTNWINVVKWFSTLQIKRASGFILNCIIIGSALVECDFNDITGVWFCNAKLILLSIRNVDSNWLLVWEWLNRFNVIT